MIESISMIVFDGERKGLLAEGKKKIFWSDGNKLNLFVVVVMGIYNCQDPPNRTFKMNAFYHIQIIPKF